MSKGTSPVRIIRAELPSGRIVEPAGCRLPDDLTFQREILDVLYGSESGGKGIAEVEALGMKGRYIVTRDFSTGRATIRTIEGRPAPPPEWISPGEFLLGRPRRLRSAKKLPQSSADEARALRRHAARLQSTAIQHESAASHSGSTSVRDLVTLPPTLERGLDALVHLVAPMATFRERTLKTVAECQSDLKASATLGTESDQTQKIRRLADEVDAANDRANPSFLERHASVITPWLLATGLAGTGLLCLGMFTRDSSFLRAGGLIVAFSLLPVLLLVPWTRRRRRLASAAKDEVLTRSHALLWQAQVALDHDDVEGDELRAIADQIARRDFMRSLEKRLNEIRGVAVSGAQTEILGADALRSGLRALKSTLALEMMEACEQAEALVERGERAAFHRGVAFALRQEADRVLRHAARCDRYARALVLLGTFDDGSATERTPVTSALQGDVAIPTNRARTPIVGLQSAP